MNRRLSLRLFQTALIAGFTLMLYVTIITQQKTPLFEHLASLLAIPWMQATLIDYYINALVIYAWIFYREHSWLARILWFVIVMTTGSIGVCFYLLLKTLQITPDTWPKQLLLRQD